MGLLDGQIAIITGAGTGIGREAALMFADEGATLVLAGRRIEPLQEVVQVIESKGGTAVARSTDMEDGEAAEAGSINQTTLSCTRALHPVCEVCADRLLMLDIQGVLGREETLCLAAFEDQKIRRQLSKRMERT